MLIDGCEGEEKGGVENIFEIGDAVKNTDEVDEAGDEADDKLGKYGFGDVLAWPKGDLANFLAKLMGFEQSDLGISSAR